MAAYEDKWFDIFGLFCLMNTCYDEMKNIIALVRRRFKAFKIHPMHYWGTG